jgi:DNA repair exonuclease SbcCD nuclease subunit
MEAASTQPYGLISDLHFHNFSSFSTLDAEGRNDRLMFIIAELERCCAETRKAGGQIVVIAGDLFHVRGSVDPSVFNPVKEAIEHQATLGMRFQAISGNHDLKSRESEELGSAMQMLGSTYFMPVHSPTTCWWTPTILVPWVSDPVAYMKAIEDAVRGFGHAGERVGDMDVICHIGFDGTLSGDPGHGVTPEWATKLGVRRVFSGHYHNHKDFGGGVFSIGAATHQTFSDVGTKAGFMIVYPDRVQWFASHAPNFIDLTGEEDPDEVPLLVDGHYVRARIETSSASDVTDARALLLKSGARGVQIIASPKAAVASRSGVSAKSLDSLEKSVESYIKEKEMAPTVSALCQVILGEARAA